MKGILAAILGTMVIGGAAAAGPALASDMPKWEVSLATFTHTLRTGMTLVDLEDGGSVAIEKKGETLHAWATSAEERRAVPDGTYRLVRSFDIECDVERGLVTACR